MILRVNLSPSWLRCVASHRIAVQSGIKVDDIQGALNGFKECRELLKGLNVAPVVDSAAPSNASASSLGTVLSRVVVSLESKGLQYFAEARLVVLDEINSVRLIETKGRVEGALRFSYQQLHNGCRLHS